MKWQILILTQPSRAAMLEQVVDQLDRQMHEQPEEIEVVVEMFDRSKTLGENRERMRRGAIAEYINFVDDDDLVAPDYIARILPLLDGVDYIGFDLHYYEGHGDPVLTSHSLAYGRWETTRGLNLAGKSSPLYLRDISHLNPMRRELALEVPLEGGFGEDHRWADKMRGRVKTEHYIPRVLYYYLWRSRKDDARDALDPWRLKMIESLSRQSTE